MQQANSTNQGQASQQPSESTFTLKSPLTTENSYNTFDSIKRIHPEMKGLKNNARLYLYGVAGEIKNDFRMKDTPPVDESLEVFGEIEIVDYDEDNQPGKKIIQTDDFICFEGESDGSSVSSLCYGQLNCFLKVSYHGDGKTYLLCVGTTFQDLKKPHPSTGYKVLKKKTDTVFVTFVDRIKYRAYVVPSFDGDDTYLLNHDADREAWADVEEPLLPKLDVLVQWREDTAPTLTEVDAGDEDDVLEVIVDDVENDQDTESDVEEALLIDYI